MERIDLLLQEYQQLTNASEKHAAFPYNALPILITVGGALLAFGNRGNHLVGAVVVVGFLLVLVGWAFAHCFGVNICVRLIALEREINSLRDDKEPALTYFTEYSSPFKTNGYLVYLITIIMLGAFIYAVACMYLWYDVHNALDLENWCPPESFWMPDCVIEWLLAHPEHSATLSVAIPTFIGLVVVSKVINIEGERTKAAKSGSAKKGDQEDRCSKKASTVI